MARSGERFIADVQASCYHLRLISEIGPTEYTAIVYDLKGKTVLFRSSAESLEASKAKAESFAKELVSGRPMVVWQRITA
jgi:hypothetical protein